MRLIIFLFSVALPLLSFAQTGSISGRVLDSKTSEPLAFANVFINTTTIGTAADADGNFTLKNIPAGMADIVYSFVGYQSYQARILMKDNEQLHVTIKLVPLEQQLDEVKVKGTRDKTWEKELKKFEKIFFGNTPFAKECKIINPYVIDFSSEGEKFNATASVPIEFQNLALGYKVSYYLKSFWSDGVEYSIIGNSRFEDLPAPSGAEAERWAKNRKDAYLGSTRHLFKSLLEDRSIESGFRLYTDRAANSKTARLPSFTQDLEKSVSVIPYKFDGIVTVGNSVFEKKILIKNRVEVHYLNKRGSAEVYRDVGYAVSWMEAKNGYVLVNNQGVLLNSRDLVVSGDMGNSRISTMLPLNYEPQVEIQVRTAGEIKAERLFESVYIQTNKPFYYPGEMIWFKGYMNYRTPGLADSLSKVLYVDLIDGNRTLLTSRVVKIDSGRISGSIRLLPELDKGNYALVAYTNWMRNYGDQNLFIKTLPVLSAYERPLEDTTQHIKNSPEVELTFNKEKYGLRDLVTVQVAMTSENDKPIPGNLSVSVVDATQVPNCSLGKNDIRKEFTFREPKSIGEPYRYTIEYGVTWNGKFESDQKPLPTSLTVVKGNLEDVRKVTTAKDGTFSMVNLDINDSTLYNFQALRGKVPYGKVTSLPRQLPAYAFNGGTTFPVERKESLQHMTSAYELPPDATLLAGVEVKSSKLEDPETRVENVYGKAQSVITKEEISKYGSIEQLLRAKATGFVLNFNGSHWVFHSNRMQVSRPERIVAGGSGSKDQGSTQQIEFPSSEPVLTIDNRQIIINAGETVGDRLMSFNPDVIDRIEISSTSSSYVGANGGFGLVAVFLKSGQGVDQNNFQKVYIKGYDSSVDFKGPNYADKNEDHSLGDFRSTLLWKKDVNLNNNGVSEFSFYTSDLRGKYRIVIEGVTRQGQPIHFEQLMPVDLE